MSQSRSLASRTRLAFSRLSVVFAAAAAATALVACGGSKAPTAAGERSDERQNEAKLAKFARCMREHGVEAKTSSGSGGQGIEIGPKGRGGSQTLERAQRACKQYQPLPQSKKVNVSPQEQVAQEEAVLKFAKCMREHGINVHGSASGGHIQIKVGGAGVSSGPNPESPAFQAAQKACQGLLPFKGKGGPDTGPSTDKSLGGQAGSGGASLHIRG